MNSSKVHYVLCAGSSILLIEKSTQKLTTKMEMSKPQYQQMLLFEKE